jgi:hypothetical protein
MAYTHEQFRQALRVVMDPDIKSEHWDVWIESVGQVSIHRNAVMEIFVRNLKGPEVEVLREAAIDLQTVGYYKFA